MSGARMASRCSAMALALSMAVFTQVVPALPDDGVVRTVSPLAAPCTEEERTEALRAIQAEVLAGVPSEVPSLEEAVKPGGVLEGWRLSHGLVVLAGSGGVAVDNIEAEYPRPQVLIYAPAAGSDPSEWLDFAGDNGPYRLAGWAYFAPYEEGSSPPEHVRCTDPSEWFVHEAGWHLMDGGMLLTEGAAQPPPPPAEPAGYFWHPRGWDIHFWRGDDGVPTISFHNPRAPAAGVRLPEGAFYYLRDGERVLPPDPPGAR